MHITLRSECNSDSVGSPGLSNIVLLSCASVMASLTPDTVHVNLAHEAYARGSPNHLPLVRSPSGVARGGATNLQATRNLGTIDGYVFF